MGIIYCATNKVNGKKYIGQTMHTLDKRKSEHKRSAEGKNRVPTKFLSAIVKYGWENFKWEVIEEGDWDRTRLSGREMYYIGKHDTFRKGYNMTVGGEGASLYTIDKIEKVIDMLCETDKGYGEIGQEVGMTDAYVRSISYMNVHKELWKDRKNPRKLMNKKQITRDKAKEISEELEKQELNIREISEKYKVGEGVVGRMIRGETFRDVWDYSQFKLTRDRWKFVQRGDTKPNNKYPKEKWEKVKEEICTTRKTLKEIAENNGMEESDIKVFNNKGTRRDVWGEDVNPRLQYGFNIDERKTKGMYELVYRNYYVDGKTSREVSGISGCLTKAEVKHFVSGGVVNLERWHSEFEEKYRGDWHDKRLKNIKYALSKEEAETVYVRYYIKGDRIEDLSKLKEEYTYSRMYRFLKGDNIRTNSWLVEFHERYGIEYCKQEYVIEKSKIKGVEFGKTDLEDIYKRYYLEKESVAKITKKYAHKGYTEAMIKGYINQYTKRDKGLFDEMCKKYGKGVR